MDWTIALRAWVDGIGDWSETNDENPNKPVKERMRIEHAT